MILEQTAGDLDGLAVEQISQIVPRVLIIHLEEDASLRGVPSSCDGAGAIACRLGWPPLGFGVPERQCSYDKGARWRRCFYDMIL
jgi:hypothetical protein